MQKLRLKNLTLQQSFKQTPKVLMVTKPLPPKIKCFHRHKNNVKQKFAIYIAIEDHTKGPGQLLMSFEIN